MYPGASEPSTAAEWVGYEMMYTSCLMFLVVGRALVLGFIGLYTGSMLRNPKKGLKRAKTYILLFMTAYYWWL